MDFILIDGDKALFMPTFGPATVVVQPGTIKGSGPATLSKTKLCIRGDESSVSVPGCTYITPQFSIPGTGTLEIAALAADQVARKTNTGKTAVLLVGSTFTARFQVQSPAQQPPPGAGSPIPDPVPQYTGSGRFVTTNLKFRGT